MTGHRIIRNLTRQGNAVLGVGCYSAALATRSNSDVAIKIGTNMDDPWLDYRGLVIDAYSNNPHVPHIHSFYSDSANEFYVCTMERLAPTTYSDESLTDFIRDYVLGYHSEEEAIEFLDTYPTRVPNPQQLLEVVNAIKENTTHAKSGRPFGMGTTTYCESEQDDDDNCEGRRLDMHRGNFMLRGEVLVITDPWCNVNMDDIADLSQWAERTVDYCG